MRRRWGRRLGLATGTLGLVVVLVVLPAATASGQESPPITIPPPPVTSPPYDMPEGSDAALRPVAPMASYACATYASLAFSFDFVGGLLLPLVFAQVTGAGPPIDPRGLVPYFQQLGQACGLVPPHLSPTRCAGDDTFAAETGAAVQEVIVMLGLEAAAPYVSVPMPTVGMLLDTIAALEGTTADQAASTAAMFEALDCRIAALADDDFDPGTDDPDTDDAGAGADDGPSALAGGIEGPAAPLDPPAPLDAAALGSAPLHAGAADITDPAPSVGSQLAQTAVAADSAHDRAWRIGYVLLSLLLVAALAMTFVAERFAHQSLADR